jgi:hypothetical protein
MNHFLVYQIIYRAREILERHAPALPAWMLAQLAGELRSMLALVETQHRIQAERERTANAVARWRNRRWN